MMKTQLREALIDLNRRMVTSIATSSSLPNWSQRAFGRGYGWLSYRIVRDGRLISSQWRKLPIHLVATLLNPGDVYVDIGASFGEIVTVAQAAVGSTGQVYAFEPQTHVFELLQQKNQSFMWENVILERAVVGDQNGECTFYVEDSSRKSSLSSGWASSIPIQCPMITLDSWSAAIGITKASLLKVDVEGAELLVICGGRRFLKETCPALILEINNRSGRLEQYGYTLEDMLSELRKLGYQSFYALRKSGLERFEQEEELLDSDTDMLALPTTVL